MTWTRLDDGWTDREDVAVLSFPARWHLLALIQWCSRTHRYDGTVRAADARRCSDVDDPAACLRELVGAGQLVDEGPAGFRVIHIASHVPPPHLRDEHRKAAQRTRKARERRRPADDTARDVAREVTRDDTEQPSRSAPVPRDVTRDPGTGQDGTGRDQQDGRETLSDPWPAVTRPPPASPARGPCDRCDQPTRHPPDDTGRRYCDRHRRQLGLADDEHHDGEARAS